MWCAARIISTISTIDLNRSERVIFSRMADENNTISKKFNFEILEFIKDRKKKKADLESIFVAAKDKDLIT